MSNFRAKYYSSLALKGVSIVSEDLDEILNQKKVNVKKLKEKAKFIRKIEPERLRVLFLLYLEVLSPYKDTWNFCTGELKESFIDLSSSISPKPNTKLELILVVQDLHDLLFFKQPVKKLKFLHILKDYQGKSKPGQTQSEPHQKRLINDSPQEDPKTLEFVRNHRKRFYRKLVDVFLRLYEDNVYKSFWCFQKCVSILGEYGGNQTFENQVYWVMKSTFALLKLRNEPMYTHFVLKCNDVAVEDSQIARKVCEWAGTMFATLFDFEQTCRMWNVLFIMRESCRDLLACLIVSILCGLDLHKCEDLEEIMEKLQNKDYELSVGEMIKRGLRLLENEKKKKKFQQIM